ncbi:MAG: non-hydrolyzing UDP-N-acetylglucosamine 2-epimerase [Candidatus Hodarchaeales archaeon]|jgi:UDP-N-acetylglucosamine 2-epimerase
MITIATIMGARPQFIKAAAISRAIAKHNKIATNGLPPISEIVFHTGQHYDYELSAVFFKELDLTKPAYHLDVGSDSHGIQTAKIIERLEDPLVKIKPDVVLVYGDTNSTLAGALTAAKLNIPVAHVEAGLRSFNRRMPEEINRVIADHISHWLFSPSNQAVKNLANEGIQNGVHMVGDVMYDVCLWHQKRADRHRNLSLELGLQVGRYALATVHRAANTDDPERLSSIFLALDKIASEKIPVILPLHPRTKKALRSFSIAVEKVKIIQPVSYEEMLFLEKNAKVILTDSGGMQKEAYWLGIPCITLRDETEWDETVESGWNVLVRSDENLILEAVQRKSPNSNRPQLYGTGHASEAIINCLVKNSSPNSKKKG